MFEFLKNLLSPKKCYSCDEEGSFLCLKCFNEIERHYYFDEICYSCKEISKNGEIHEKCKNKVYFDKTIILTHYKLKVIKKLIKDFKFYGKKDIVGDLGELLIEKCIKNMKEELKNYKKDDFVVISPPMSFFRKMKRGYNHSELLAKYISKNMGFNYEKKLILKNKQTRQQSKLNRQDRLSNLDKAFKINKNKVDIVDKKIIILIDDVISTGTTVNEISKILKSHNPLKIIVLTIASD